MTLNEINAEILHLNTDYKLITKRLLELKVLKDIEEERLNNQMELKLDLK